MGRVLLKTVLGIGVVLVICIITSVWMIWKRPMTVDAHVSRLALSRVGFEKSRIATPSGRMTVWEGGAGQCLVLLHGLGDQAGAWTRMAPPLLDDYRVLIPDLPGHWKSDPRDGSFGIDIVFAGVETMMDKMCSGEDAILIGNSLGAWVSLLYAREYPERVARVVAVNGGGLQMENSPVTLTPKNRQEARETMKALMGPATPQFPDFVLDDFVRRARVGPASRFVRTAELTNAFGLDGRLGEIAVPVEIVWGNADGLFPMDYAQRLLKGLPRARLHEVNGCGHVPHRECPLAVLEAIKRALSLPVSAELEEMS